jgi:L-lactate dehydrogenase complex protein LldG
MVAPHARPVVTSARDEILARIRGALDPAPPVPAIPRGYRSAGDLAVDPMLDLFVERLVDYRATVHRTTAAALTTTLMSTLDSAGRVVVPPGLPAGWAPGTAVPDTDLSPSELDNCDTVLTGCVAACAETGTIVLDGSPDQGRRAISLVPDRHVCVVRADQVVQTVPELLRRLAPERPLTFISGPSATSDIELHRVEGVHGPRTLVVVLIAG